jgi:O-antigen ligase
MLLIALSAIVFMALARGLPLGLGRLPRGFRVCAVAWIALCAASVAWSDDRAYTASELQREVLYGAFAIVVLFVGTRSMRDARIATYAVLCGTLLLGTFEWIRHFMPWLPYATKYEAAQGPFSTHIALAAPLLALLAWPEPGGFAAGPKTLAAFAVGIVVAGLATENRMLWLALAAGCIVAFAVFQAGAAPDAQRARMLRILLGTLALIAIAVAASWEYKAARYYPGASTAVESISMDDRPRIWAMAKTIVAERPWTGHGFGREIAGDRIERSVPTTTNVHLRHAHNVFLDMAMQLGGIGTLVFMALLAALAHLYAGTRHLPAGGGIAVAGLALLATFVVKNLTDDFFYRPNSLTFWALNGMLLALAVRVGRGETPLRDARASIDTPDSQ